MILVSVGSSDDGFDRVIRIVDELKAKGRIKDKVIVQRGYGSYEPKNAEECFDFTSWETINELNKKSSCVISHAGAGSILTALQYGTPLIAVPRLKELGEHTNNHQVETARVLESQGKILVANNEKELLGCLEKVKAGWKPATSDGNRALVKDICKFLDGR